ASGGITETTDYFDGFLKRPRDLPVAFKIVGYPDTHFSIRGQLVKIMGRCGVATLGKYTKYQRSIFDTASHNTGMTEPADRLARILFALKDALGIDEAIGAFEPHHTTTCSGQSAGSNGVRIERGIAHTARYSGG